MPNFRNSRCRRGAPHNGFASDIVRISVRTSATIVVESRWQLLTEFPAMYDHRLGVVLGRAVAHEIGHYLLHTNTHARRGLMRARIEAREFADLRSGSFRLDEAAEAHLASLAARGAFSPETTTGFSYPTP